MGWRASPWCPAAAPRDGRQLFRSTHAGSRTLLPQESLHRNPFSDIWTVDDTPTPTVGHLLTETLAAIKVHSILGKHPVPVLAHTRRPNRRGKLIFGGISSVSRTMYPQIVEATYEGLSSLPHIQQAGPSFHGLETLAPVVMRRNLMYLLDSTRQHTSRLRLKI